MKNINLKWKYGVVALVVATFCACSENHELAQMVNKQEQQSSTRTANWFTKEVTLDSIGTLEAKVTDAMVGEELSKLEKLVVTGPMAAADFTYLRSYLSHLKSLDLEDATINGSDDAYWNPNYGSVYLQNDTICRYMFSNWYSLKEFKLPSTTKYIDNQAFYNCDSLQSIVIPDEVKILRNNTFQYCYALSSVTLPLGLESIEENVFYDCESLKSIVIPDNVKFIGYRAFYECGLLSAVEMSSNSELDSIANYAFYRTGIKTMVIPEKVRYIGEYAFYDCSSLSSVVLPSNLESIASQTFYNCDSLQSIAIPEKVKYIGNRAFEECKMLSSVDMSLASELDSIAYRAFANSGLQSVALPDKVRILDNNAFYQCQSLESIKFSSNLESIGSSCITSCKIDSLYLPSSLRNISSYAFEDNIYIKKVVLPEGVTSIGHQIFDDCSALTEITIPSTVTSIEEGVLSWCTNLQAVFWKAPLDVPNSVACNNTNCLLYIETDQEIAIDECWTNVIKNGVAQSAITIQADNNNEFKIFKEFTAPEVTYIRYFGGYTNPGESSGWQTIVLPFTPDSIYHESKGQIAPFNSEIEGAKPFWLRELTADGFVDVTSITPDKAYIIAMPNNSDYLDEYRLNGTITFTAKNVTLAKTPDELEPSVGPDFEFHPTYDYVKKALYVYALQDSRTFARCAADIYPFEAYVTAIGGGRSSRTSFEIDGRSKNTRSADQPNKTGIPQIGDM